MACSSFTCTNIATFFLISSSLCLLLFSPLISCHEDVHIQKLVINVCKKTQYEDICFDTFEESANAKGVTDVNALARVAIASIMKRTNGKGKLHFEKIFGTSKAEDVIKYLESALFEVEECQKVFDEHEKSVNGKLMEKASAENSEILALCNNAISICQNLPA